MKASWDIPPSFWESQDPKRKQRHRVEGCRTCENYGNRGPSHDASDRCESGGHTHCTCDTCF